MTKARTYTLLFSSLLILGCVQAVLLPQPASASCGKIETALIHCDTGGSNNGIWAILLIVINLLTAGIGIVAVGGIVYAAILYTSARDDAGHTSKAKGLITNVVIGIVGFGLLYSFLQYIIPGGFMNTLTSPPTVADAPKDPEPPKNVNDTGKTNTGNGQGACYEVGGATKGSRKKMYHISGSKPYAFENSPQGIRYAAKHGYDSIDLDIRMTKDGVPVATHGAAPLAKSRIKGGFRDTTGKIKKRSTRVSDMTFSQIQQLKHVDGYRIYSLQELIPIAKSNGINLALETKTPKSFKNKLPEIAAWLNDAHIKTVIMGQPGHAAGMNSTLSYARKLGFWTRDITAATWQKATKDNNLCKQFES